MVHKHSQIYCFYRIDGVTFHLYGTQVISMKAGVLHFKRLFLPPYVDNWGEGTSHIKTLMIYPNGIGPKCAPDVILLNLADELSFCQEFFCTI